MTTNFLVDDACRCKILTFNVFLIIAIGCSLYGISYHAIHYSSIYPTSSRLVFAGWIWHLAARVMVMWYPMSFFFIHWRRRGTCFVIIYIAGCLLGMFLAFIYAIGLDLYSKHPNSTEIEYAKDTLDYIVKEKELPFWIKHDSENNCCTWSNLLLNDTNLTIPLNKLSMENNAFMQPLIQCHEIDVTRMVNFTYDEFALIANRTGTGNNSICESIRFKWVKQQHNLMYTCAVIISFFGAFSCVLYVHYHIEYVRHPFEWNYMAQIPVPEVIKVPIILESKPQINNT